MSKFGEFVSVFDEPYDVVVYGGGYIGFAAAQELSRQGRSVLLIEPSGQLLWESSNALVNRIADSAGNSASAEWSALLARFEAKHGIANGYLDTALAEVIAAGLVISGMPKVLYYAQAVALEISGNEILSAVMATKDGPRQIHAAQWIDATETGLLSRLYPESNAVSLRSPLHSVHSMMLQAKEWSKLEPRLAKLRIHGRPVDFLHSVQARERRLCWQSDGTSWDSEMLSVLRLLRTHVASSDHLLVSHVSSRPFPVYDASPVSILSECPQNLQVLSPALLGVSLGTLCERFTLGVTCGRAIPSDRKASRSHRTRSVEFPKPHQVISCDVLVAGAGTAGALASLAAAREGVRVHCIESAFFPGGVGTEGGITGYFNGVKGGLQSEVDSATGVITQLLEGKQSGPDRWHHEAKRMALLQHFAADQVVFHHNALLCGVEKSSRGHVSAALVAMDGRLVRFEARALIDSTGDGDLCALARATFVSGREGDQRPLAYTQAAYHLKSTEQGYEVFTQNFDAGWMVATDPDDLSHARLQGVAQYGQLKWDEAHRPFAIAAQLGIRQSRHIATDYILTLDDAVRSLPFADSIGQAECHADSHSIDFEFEDDETLFFYWACRLFRHRLKASLPYRMLLPKGLDNVWIACRSAGMSPAVFYAIRVQRDMQRIGEAAGIAAALCCRANTSSRNVDFTALRAALIKSGAYTLPALVADLPINKDLEALSSGRTGIHLWNLYKQRARYEESVIDLSKVKENAVSFYAACLLAMWRHPLAEERLLHAVVRHEEGPAASKVNAGAYGQEIDIPFWLLAVALLRRCGSTACVPVLQELASHPENILNVRTAIALTVESLVQDQKISGDEARTILDALLSSPIPDPQLPPSRSIWRSLRGVAPVKLPSEFGVDTRQDHSWQLHLVIYRIHRRLHIPSLPEVARYLTDSRGFVRQAFQSVVSWKVPEKKSTKPSEPLLHASI